MGALPEGVAAIDLLALIVAAIAEVVSGKSAPPAAEVVPRSVRAVSDWRRHRWTRWQVLKEGQIHLYGEVDDGRELPDRIVVVLRRG